MATGGIKIPSTGETTPEYIAVKKSYEEIEPAIISDDFIRRARSCDLITARNSSSPPLDMALKEIFHDPVGYYSLQHVVATLNVGNRFDKGIGKMEKAFQCKNKVYDMTWPWVVELVTVSLHIMINFTVEMRKYIPASSSEDPKVEPGTYVGRLMPCYNKV